MIPAIIFSLSVAGFIVIAFTVALCLAASNRTLDREGVIIGVWLVVAPWLCFVMVWWQTQ